MAEGPPSTPLTPNDPPPLGETQPTPVRPGANSHDRVFVDHLKTRGYHPVIFFGTQLAGKTALLLSLLTFATRNNEMAPLAHVTFGESSAKGLFPADYSANNKIEETGETIFSRAIQLFDNGIPQFDAGRLPPATQQKNPIFVPIEMTIGTQYYRYLFIEANGEWFHRDVNTQEYQPLVNELTWLLTEFDRAMSILFVLPSTARNIHADKLDYNQMLTSVRRCIDLYASYHRRRFRDNLLLLGTQWDTLPNSSLLTDATGVVDFSVEDFDRVARTWGPVWAGFKALQVEAERRAVMPYSIGRVADAPLGASALTHGLYSQETAFNQFPRILWNWLYGNASEAAGGGRDTLFEDVDNKERSGVDFLSEALLRFYAVR